LPTSRLFPYTTLFRSHGRHIAAAANMLGHYPALARGAHRAVAFLPLGHVMGRDATITLPLLAEIVPHYPDDVEGFAETLYDVARSEEHTSELQSHLNL